MHDLSYYPRMIKALQDYVANDVGPQDDVGLLLASGQLQFPFSDDKQLLAETISGVLEKLNLTMVNKSRLSLRLPTCRHIIFRFTHQGRWLAFALKCPCGGQVNTNTQPMEKKHLQIANVVVPSAAQNCVFRLLLCRTRNRIPGKSICSTPLGGTYDL